MEENPGIQAKWDGGCSRDSLTSGKSAVSGKEEQHGNIDLGAGDPTEGSKPHAGEGGLWESFPEDTGSQCSDQQIHAPPRRAWLCLLGAVSGIRSPIHLFF